MESEYKIINVKECILLSFDVTVLDEKYCWKYGLLFIIQARFHVLTNCIKPKVSCP